jgi:hypothetical protein
MGLREWIHAVRTEPDVVWLNGEFRVTAASTPAFGAKASSGWWTGLLTLPGHEPVAMKYSGIVQVDRWPQPGQTVPVSAVPGDAFLFKFLWNDVPTREEAGLDEARRLADEQRTSSEERRPTPTRAPWAPPSCDGTADR